MMDGAIGIMRKRDEETGRYADEYPNDAFLEAIKAEGGLAGTGEIAAEVGCAHDTAYKRLVELRDAGVVSSQKVGTTLAWSIVED